jgi:hypothetical protein
MRGTFNPIFGWVRAVRAFATLFRALFEVINQNASSYQRVMIVRISVLCTTSDTAMQMGSMQDPGSVALS